jgi:CheY-like chemotaxis protein
VDVAHDGEEALELIRKNSYAAIFLDLMMPRLDGYHVLDALKEENPILLRRVVVMTAVAPDALQRLSGTAIARVLPKPFDINQILASANDVALIQRAG